MTAEKPADSMTRHDMSEAVSGDITESTKKLFLKILVGRFLPEFH